MVEQRRFMRTPLDVPVTFTRKGSEGTFEGRARDVSVGGMFVETPATIAFGAEVAVLVRLPDSKADLTLPGVVRWVRDGGMGVQFGNLGAKETHEIIELIRRS